MQLIAFDDFDDPTAGACRGECGTRPLIACVGEDAQDEGPQRTRAFVEHEARAVAILDVGEMNGNAQQEAQRIDEDMPLAAGDLLARIVALRIEQSPPFWRRFGALTVDDGSGGTGFASVPFAHGNVKSVMDALQRAVPKPSHEPMATATTCVLQNTARSATAGSTNAVIRFSNS